MTTLLMARPKRFQGGFVEAWLRDPCGLWAATPRTDRHLQDDEKDERCVQCVASLLAGDGQAASPKPAWTDEEVAAFIAAAGELRPGDGETHAAGPFTAAGVRSAEPVA